MNRYLENKTEGELWLRELNDRVSPAYTVLSSLYLKYQPINSTFYSELTSNKILRFDMFNDVVYLETASASVFEKFTYEDNYIKPYNQVNLINPKTNINNVYKTNIDYWFDEYDNDIYFGEILPKTNELFNGIAFEIIFKKYSCTEGTIVKTFQQYVKLVFNETVTFTDFILESPKLTYNSDSKTFNISLVARIKNEFGLLSINIIDTGYFTVKQINGFFPKNTINNNISETYPLSL
jgi:hypothetical protein